MSDTWYLRSDRGVIFGPAGIGVLREWAEQGRIGPGSQLSTDRESWVAAHTLADLEMDWMVDAGSGMIGPVNLRALRDLLLDGTVPSTARLVHRQSSSKQPLYQKLDDIFAPPPQSLPQSGTPADDAAILEATLERVDNLEARLKAASDQNESTAAELEKVQATLEAERQRWDTRQKELEAAHAELTAAQEMRQRMSDAATEQERHRLSAEEQLQATLVALRTERESSSTELASTREMLRLAQEACAAQEQQRMAAEDQSRVALAELRAALESERMEARAARDNAAEQRQTCLSGIVARNNMESELRAELKAARDDLAISETGADAMARKHAAAAEQWHHCEAKLRQELETRQTEFRTLKEESAVKERQHLAAAEEWTRTHASIRAALQSSEAGRETERELRRQQSITTTESEQAHRSEINRLVQEMAGLRTTATHLADSLALAQERLDALTREAQQKNDLHFRELARLQADRDALQITATMANQRENALSHRITQVTLEKELLDARLRSSEGMLAARQTAVGDSMSEESSRAAVSEPEPEIAAFHPTPEQPRVTEEQPEVHEPEVLRPSSRREPQRPHDHDAPAARASVNDSNAETSSKGYGRRSSTAKEGGKPATLADIEAQAHRDLLAWHKGKTARDRTRRDAR